jgi:hypothetical protein
MVTFTIDLPALMLAVGILIPCGIAAVGFFWTLYRLYPRMNPYESYLAPEITGPLPQDVDAPDFSEEDGTFYDADAPTAIKVAPIIVPQPSIKKPLK